MKQIVSLITILVLLVSCESQHIVNSGNFNRPATIYEYAFSENSQHNVNFGPEVSHLQGKEYESLVSINPERDGSYLVMVHNKSVNDYARTYSFTYNNISDLRTDVDGIYYAVENHLSEIDLHINSNYTGYAEIEFVYHDDCVMLHITYGSLNFIFPLKYLK